jgi:hypothetical protein
VRWVVRVGDVWFMVRGVGVWRNGGCVELWAGGGKSYLMESFWELGVAMNLEERRSAAAQIRRGTGRLDRFLDGCGLGIVLGSGASRRLVGTELRVDVSEHMCWMTSGRWHKEEGMVRASGVWAHSKNEAGERHELVAHLTAVAAMARELAEPFGGGEVAYWAGLWHDLGKFHPEFQEYLLEPEANPGRRRGVPAKSIAQGLDSSGQATLA